MDRIAQEPPTREALYQRLIMERAREPRHQGVLEPADGAADGDNPFCGDRVRVTIRRSTDGRIARVLHRTRGCAICMAAADLMAESVEGQDPAAIRSLYSRFDGMLRNGSPESLASSGDGAKPEARLDDLGLLNAFENLHEYRSRIRCATLPWSALLDAIESEGTR